MLVPAGGGQRRAVADRAQTVGQTIRQLDRELAPGQDELDAKIRESSDRFGDIAGEANDFDEV